MRARVLSFIGWLVISLWSRTLRIRFVNRDILQGLEQAGNNAIFAFWHGRQFLLFWTHQRANIVIPASESRDGEIQAGILARFGFGIVRGSSKRRGDRAALGLVEALRKGRSIALAVDGPRGPIYEVKEGVTYLAGKLGKQIVPVATGARKAWVLEKIWDKYLLPKPFSQCVVVYGKPITVNGTSSEELEGKREELAAALNQVMEEADRYFGQSAQKAKGA